MSRKKILAALIISSCALTACDSEDLPIKENENFSYSRLQFNPTGGQLPKPNDLLFSGTTDGTLQLPDEIKAVAASGAATTYADNTIGIGALDGWSTTHPLVMDVDLLDGRTIVSGAGNYLAPNAVRIFPVTLNGPLSTDASNCSTSSSVSLTVCDTNGELQYGSTGDFIVKVIDDGANDGKGTIAVVWLKPLPAKSSFLYAFTDAIKDSSGRIIRGSKTYEFVKQNQGTNDVGPDGSSTRNLQGLMNNYDKTLVDDYGMDASKVTFAGVFTTQSTLDVVSTVKSLIVSTDTSHAPFQPTSVVNTTIVAPSVALALGMIPADPRYTDSNATKLYASQLTVPYYLSKTGISSYWKAKGDSPLALLGAANASGSVATAIKTACPTADFTNAKSLVGCEATIDPFNHLTRYNPLPMPTGTQDVAVQITVPSGAKPAGGWPVNIAVHGLGTFKETTLQSAGALAKQGVATIAIDMPLHGSRGFDLNNDGVFDISATDYNFANSIGKGASYAVTSSPLQFINVNSGLTVRDNFRQAIVDLLSLRKMIPAFTDPNPALGDIPTLFNPLEVSTHGLSLGAITATSFAAYANQAFVPANPTADAAYALQSVSLVAPTGGLAWVFNESPTFGPLLMDQLVVLVAKTQGQTITLPTDPAALTAFRSSNTYKKLEAAADASVVPSLLFSVQTQIDSIDPINMAALLANNTPKLHVIEISGNKVAGGTNESDQVLPNIGSVPVTGTEALVKNITSVANPALGCLTDSTGTPIRGLVRFAKGHHSSLINPGVSAGITNTYDTLYASLEMQNQVATFAKGILAVDTLTSLPGLEPRANIIATCP